MREIKIAVYTLSFQEYLDFTVKLTVKEGVGDVELLERVVRYAFNMIKT
ncbi:MAG: hypothetical protein Q8R90_10365 [Bacteroidales bacterium]|nr:hypothetical protein [Bacteroidales bacterium]MDZ4058877.1 hypothetical protein [Bacteroidales bacterium]